MDNYIVSARKYRPSTFKSVIGQDALTTTLKNAIATNKLAHAYLFCGPRGVGKTTLARIFAKTINCLNLADDYEACNKCESCVAFNEQRSYNIHELDAASNNSVDDIRTLIDQVRIPPQIGNYKVYIIDEVHMLSQAAFNSFLKTLEEPPAHAIFILATTEKHKIIPTILSRCQVYDFNRITISDIVNHLQYVADAERVQVEPEALNIIAQKADGGMRDALSIFDQSVSFTGGNITYQSVIENLNVLDYEYYFKITEAVLAGDVAMALLTLNDILNHGFEGQHVITGLASHFRDLMISKVPQAAKVFEVGASIKERYIETAKRCSLNFLYKAIDIANEADINYRLSNNKRLLLELALIKLCQLSDNQAAVNKTAEKKTDAIKPIATTKKKQEKSKPQQTKETVADKENSDKPKKIVQAEQSVKPKTAERNKKGYTFGVSLSSLSGKENEKPIKKKETAKPALTDLPFTDEQLKKEFHSFSETLKGEVILKNAIEKATLKKTDENRFEAIVSSEINRGYLQDNSVQITNYLKKKFNKKEISMTITVEESMATYTPITALDKFDEMVKKNPQLQSLSDEFDLELN